MREEGNRKDAERGFRFQSPETEGVIECMTPMEPWTKEQGEDTFN